MDTDNLGIKADAALEEKIIYDKLTGRIPIYITEMAARQEAATGSMSSPADVANERILTEEEQAAQCLAEICQRLGTMEDTRENLAFRPIYSCRKFIGWLIVFSKRVVRKCLKWYLEPVCFQQTEFNNAVTPAIGRLTELQQFFIKKIQHLEDSFAEKEMELIKQEKALRENMSVQIDSLRYPLEEELAVLSENYAILLDRSRRTEQRYTQMLQEQTEKIQQQEKIIQTQGGYIERLTIEHNGRLDALENHFDALESHYNSRMSTAEQLLQDLEDGGAFASVNCELQMRRSSLSQSGEDAILAYIFMVLGMAESKCSYLDLGANHAKKFSNTYYFYQKGSRGVLVEANPKLIAELKFYRSGDVILNRCIAKESGQSVDFYIMSGDGLSTPNREQAERVVAYNPAIRMEDVVEVQTITVNEVLDTYFDGAPVFINIDIEGAEMDILGSIDFEAHRPLAIILEMIPYRRHLVVGAKNQEMLQFMADRDYVEYAFTGINSIFLDKKQMRDLGVLE